MFIFRLSNIQKVSLVITIMVACLVCFRFKINIKPRHWTTFSILPHKYNLMSDPVDTRATHFRDKRVDYTSTEKYSSPLGRHETPSFSTTPLKIKKNTSKQTTQTSSIPLKNKENIHKQTTQTSSVPARETSKAFHQHKHISKGDPTVVDRAKNVSTYPEEEIVPKEEKQHVAFVKVHKAASSTMHNILIRYGIRHDLDMMLPRRGIHINQNGYRIHRNNLVPSEEQPVIQCTHLVFNYKEWSAILPNDTVYVGILREPFSQFLSAFVYYTHVFPSAYFRPILSANSENPVGEFLNKTDLYLRYRRPNSVMINNRMSVDFGFPLDDFEASKTNQKNILAYIKHLDNVFDIILIAEMFDESLVLLRRRLNWETKDIIYMKVNEFKGKAKRPWVSRKEYPTYTMDKFAKFAALDIALYDYFYKKFKTQLAQQGGDFQEEVTAFKKLIYKVAGYCSDDNEKTESWKMNIPPTQHTTGFSLTADDCKLMQSKEWVLTKTAREVQLARLHLDANVHPLPAKKNILYK